MYVCMYIYIYTHITHTHIYIYIYSMPRRLRGPTGGVFGEKRSMERRGRCMSRKYAYV